MFQVHHKYVCLADWLLLLLLLVYNLVPFFHFLRWIFHIVSNFFFLTFLRSITCLIWKCKILLWYVIVVISGLVVVGYIAWNWLEIESGRLVTAASKTEFIFASRLIYFELCSLRFISLISVLMRIHLDDPL